MAAAAAAAAAVETEEEEEFIKIGLPDGDDSFEWVWAVIDIDSCAQFPYDVAEVRNTPYAGFCAYGDKVRFDTDSREAIEVVERNGWMASVKYETGKTPEETKAIFKSIVDKLREHDCKTEGFVAGWLGVTCPLSMTKDQLKKILDEMDKVTFVEKQDA